MQRILASGVAAAVVGGVMMMGASTPASAQLAPSTAPLGAAINTGVATDVQYRGRGWRGRGGYRGGRGYYRRGPGPGAVIGGLAAGAIIGGALAAQRPYYGGPYYGRPGYSSAEAYCAQRFRSWDPVSRTYLGYDGLRHPCP